MRQTAAARVTPPLVTNKNQLQLPAVRVLINLASPQVVVLEVPQLSWHRPVFLCISGRLHWLLHATALFSRLSRCSTAAGSVGCLIVHVQPSRLVAQPGPVTECFGHVVSSITAGVLGNSSN
jgi:hypothetical protein